MTDLRDVIARAIYASDFDIPAGELEEQWAWSAARSSYQNNADAVLAVLADLPADVIEQAAEAICDWNGDVWEVAASSSDTFGRDAYLHGASRVLAAVFGGEQGE